MKVFDLGRSCRETPEKLPFLVVALLDAPLEICAVIWASRMYGIMGR